MIWLKIATFNINRFLKHDGVTAVDILTYNSEGQHNIM